MSVIVTDTGFTPVADTVNPGLADLGTGAAVDLAHTDDPTALEPLLAQLTLIRVAFPSFSDGRAFTIARRLRMLGYTGELRALGPVISDQYAMARRVGFDAVEIPDALAERQPEDQWKFRANWKAHDYQSRLRA
ncbi:DUF934 domain-containing protein [Gemmobacter serpentinus]|uniref:DUF934 domain-containing protein n=1 Tax=Gemmobacter serpentinus TaxID=2652247 RepID=UPI00124ED07F|nr:DUF934 domain-containing protein [Gemmobacter serpentinus]